jgi:competence protein ComEC
MNLESIDFVKRNLLYFCLGGFILGVVFQKYISQSISIYYLIVIIAIAIITYLIKSSKNVVFATIFLFSITLSAFALGALRYEAVQPKPSLVLEDLIEQKITLTGVVQKIPDVGTTQRLTISTEYGKILSYVSPYPAFEYGDEIEINGILNKPEAFETSSGRLFDYPSFLRKEKILYILQFADAELISKDKGNKVNGALYGLKKKSLEVISRYYKEPEASLLAGITLGDKGKSKEMEEDFRKTGLTHIVVLSGYNIAIVAFAVMFLLKFLPQNYRFFFGSVAIILFTIMVASGAATVRAAIMALSVIFAKLLKRGVSVWRSLFLAVFLMLTLNPLILFSDPGFQLSFLATAGIVSFGDLLGRKLHFVTNKFAIREIFAVSLAAQLSVLPLIIFQSGEFALYSVPANLLVLPMVAPAMFFGIASVLVLFIFPLLATPIIFFTHFLLLYIVEIARFLSALPYSTLVIPEIKIIWVLFLYFSIGFFLFYKDFKKTRRIISALEHSLRGRIMSEQYSQSPQK